MPALEDLKQHLNVIGDDDDTLLSGKIAAAEAHVANHIGEDAVTYTDAEAPIKEAILQLAAHLYENREAALVGMSASELPFGFHDLLTPYRKWSF